MVEPDGTILIYDEEKDEWNIWEGKDEDPLPPPEFLEVDARRRSARFTWPAHSVMRVLLFLFVFGAVGHVVCQIGFSVAYNSEAAWGDTVQLLADLTQVLQVMWQVALGGILVVVGVKVLDYISEKRFIEEKVSQATNDESNAQTEIL